MDNIYLTAGWATATGKGLYLTEMKLEVIPEPSTLFLLMAPLAAMAVRRLRRIVR